MAKALGSLPALLASVGLVIMWALSGPIFGFSDTWQLVINTTTTVATFWMVFVIQNTTNREAEATQLKLDELIRAVHEARNDFLEIDDETDEALERRRAEFEQLARRGEGGRDPDQMARGSERRGSRSQPSRAAPRRRRSA